MTTTVLAQSAKKDANYNADNDFLQYNLPAYACMSECFSTDTSKAASFVHIQTKDPSGNTTSSHWRPVVWDEDKDGNEEPIDVDRYIIHAIVNKATPTGDGQLHLMVSVRAEDRQTGAKRFVEAFNIALKQSDITGSDD